MGYERFKINLLTRIKSSLGLYTKSDEINMELEDLKKEQKQIDDNIDVTSNQLFIVSSIVRNIDQIWNFAEEDVSNGNANKFSLKLMSYQLSIERAKKQNVEISQIVDMQQKQQELKEKCIKEYINSIIIGNEYDNSNCTKIKIIITNICFDLSRIKINNYSVLCYEDLEVIKKYLMSKELSLNTTKNKSINASNDLRSKIVNIELSHEKYLADYAAELVNQKKSR